MTNEEAIIRLKNIDIRDALQEDYDALYMAIKALEIELLTDKEHLKDILADVPNDKCIDWIEAIMLNNC